MYGLILTEQEVKMPTREFFKSMKMREIVKEESCKIRYEGERRSDFGREGSLGKNETKIQAKKLSYLFNHIVVFGQIPHTFHNALFPMGCFVQVVMWIGINIKTYRCKIGMTSEDIFHH